MAGACRALSDPNSQWNFCPNIAAAYALTILFGLTMCCHIMQMIYHRKLYSLVVIISGVLQFLAYVFRILSIVHVESALYWTLQFCLILIAPLFTNAYAYMVLGRAVYNFTTDARIFGLNAWDFGLLFVSVDIFAFLVQVAGALIASQASTSNGQRSTVLLGLHVYMGGIGLQLLSIFVFLGLAIRLHQRLRTISPANPKRTAAFAIQYVVYFVVLLIAGRIVFRLIEYANGLTSAIPRHEVYQYIFDSTLMFLALVLFNIWHPGRLMPGKESDYPGRKIRKQRKKNGEVVKGNVDNMELQYVP